MLHFGCCSVIVTSILGSNGQFVILDIKNVSACVGG